MLGRHATRRVGASPVFAELHQASWALELARLALGSQPQGTGVTQFRDSPIDLLVAAAPHAALEAARAVLGSLLDLPEDELELLLGTFEAWVRANGSATAAGRGAVLPSQHRPLPAAPHRGGQRPDPGQPR